jgi:serine/threonine protein kinase
VTHGYVTATGRAPFGTGSESSILYGIVHKEPDLGQVAGPLRRLIRCCLAKSPADRLTARELLAEIVKYQEDNAELTAPAGPARSEVNRRWVASSWSGVMTMTVPAGTCSAGAITAEFSSASPTISFNHAAPTARSVSPTTVASGQHVTVRGNGFGTTQGHSRVIFDDHGIGWGLPDNGAVFQIDSWSDDSITFTLPPLPCRSHRGLAAYGMFGRPQRLPSQWRPPTAESRITPRSPSASTEPDCIQRQGGRRQRGR